MTTVVLIRRFLSDYVRNPVNLLLLAVVPTVLVVVVAGSLAKFAALLGGLGGPPVQTAAAGWAAAFIAGIAMYFQTTATRDADRRLVIAGLPLARLSLARLLTGGCLRRHPDVRSDLRRHRRSCRIPGPQPGQRLRHRVVQLDPRRLLRPAMVAANLMATRWLPTHFVSLWMVDLPSDHSGRLGNLGWALTVTLAAATAGWAVTVARTHTARLRRRIPHPGSQRSQTAGALQAAWCDARRNPTLWVLFVVVPVVFILAADAVTPDKLISIRILEHGQRIAASFPMSKVQLNVDRDAVRRDRDGRIDIRVPRPFRRPRDPAVCPSQGPADVLEKYIGEAVSMVDRDQVDVLAQPLVKQVGPAECGASEEDQLLTAVSTQRREDV